ncbi:hypothetical protein [Kitasatospora griseola]|uniref:hypothetical protein n=1 Tax=Kitasatospora griseola TaxID=2064 RepID=UPI00381E6030
MGYNVHITRRASWWDEDGPEIGADEWEAAVAADPELVGARDDSGTERWAELVGPAGEMREALWWRPHLAFAKHPSDRMIAKMVELARVFGARVQGDDGEHYDRADCGCDDCVELRARRERQG